jgi:hypothetical protein
MQNIASVGGRPRGFSCPPTRNVPRQRISKRSTPFGRAATCTVAAIGWRPKDVHNCWLVRMYPTRDDVSALRYRGVGHGPSRRHSCAPGRRVALQANRSRRIKPHVKNPRSFRVVLQRTRRCSLHSGRSWLCLLLFGGRDADRYTRSCRYRDTRREGGLEVSVSPRSAPGLLSDWVVKDYYRACTE